MSAIQKTCRLKAYCVSYSVNLSFLRKFYKDMNENEFCQQHFSKSATFADSANLILLSKSILSCLQILLQTSAGWLSHRYIHFYASHAENRNDFSSGRRISFLYLRLTSYCRTFLRRYLVVYRLYLCTFVHILINCEVPNTSNAYWREFPKHLLSFHFAISPMTLQSAETCVAMSRICDWFLQ